MKRVALACVCMLAAVAPAAQAVVLPLVHLGTRQVERPRLAIQQLVGRHVLPAGPVSVGVEGPHLGVLLPQEDGLRDDPHH